MNPSITPCSATHTSHSANTRLRKNQTSCSGACRFGRYGRHSRRTARNSCATAGASCNAARRISRNDLSTAHLFPEQERVGEFYLLFRRRQEYDLVLGRERHD